jgi:hypothetical protein
MKPTLRICLLPALALASFLSAHPGISSPSFAQSPASHVPTEFATLTVTSTCASARILIDGEEAKTPFNKRFVRGERVMIEVIDQSVFSCNALPVVFPFRRLTLGKEPLPTGQNAVEVVLERDIALLIHYGLGDEELVTLSVWGGCDNPASRIVARLSETAIGGQEGNFLTHFDALFLKGQTIRLEAPELLGGCGNLGITLYFRHWSAGGKNFPDDQRIIDLKLDKHTTAVAVYGYPPSRPIRVETFELFRNGKETPFIRAGDRLNRYTMTLTGGPFNSDTGVLVDGLPVETVRLIAPDQMEATLPNGKAKKPGLVRIIAISPEGLLSNTSVVEIRKK